MVCKTKFVSILQLTVLKSGFGVICFQVRTIFFIRVSNKVAITDFAKKVLVNSDVHIFSWNWTFVTRSHCLMSIIYVTDFWYFNLWQFELSKIKAPTSIGYLNFTLKNEKVCSTPWFWGFAPIYSAYVTFSSHIPILWSTLTQSSF